MNCQWKLVKPRNDCTSFLLDGTGHLETLATLMGFMQMEL